MTLAQAIRASERIRFITGPVSLWLNKKQAHGLRRDFEWVHHYDWDGGEESHWELLSGVLYMWIPQ